MPTRRRRRNRKDKNSNAKLKLVIRNLPPSLPEEEFWESTKEYEQDISWQYYHPGKLR